MALVIVGLKIVTLGPDGYVCEEFVECPCDDGETTFSPAVGVLPLALPPGTTQFTISVVGTNQPLLAIQFTLDAGAPGGIPQYVLSVTPPIGVPQYTVLNAPLVTPQIIQYTVNPATGILSVAQFTVETVGVARPINQFTVYPGPYAGVWQFQVQNNGGDTGSLTQFVLHFAPQTNALTLSTSAVATGQDVALTLTAGGGTPAYVSVNWGDGGDEEWSASTTGWNHTYADPGTYDIVTRVWTAAGLFTEFTEEVETTATIVFNSGSGNWNATVTDTITWTVVAGGGGGENDFGGADGGAGGGGGERRTGTLAVTMGNNYPYVIGAGGGPGVVGVAGDDTTFNTTLVAKGGGGGGAGSGGIGGNGGSGGTGTNGVTGGSSLGGGGTGGNGGASGSGAAGGAGAANAGVAGGAGTAPGGGGGGGYNGGIGGGAGASGRLTIVLP